MGIAEGTGMTDMCRADKWPVKELTMQNIRDVAEHKRLSLEGVDILDVVSSVEKGVEVALENWDQIVAEAIIHARARKCVRR